MMNGRCFLHWLIASRFTKQDRSDASFTWMEMTSNLEGSTSQSSIALKMAKQKQFKRTAGAEGNERRTDKRRAN